MIEIYFALMMGVSGQPTPSHEEINKGRIESECVRGCADLEYPGTIYKGSSSRVYRICTANGPALIQIDGVEILLPTPRPRSKTCGDFEGAEIKLIAGQVLYGVLTESKEQIDRSTTLDLPHSSLNN